MYHLWTNGKRTIQHERGDNMCIHCKGMLTHDKTDYIENSKNIVVLVRDVPCEKCSQCGETYFAHDIVLELEEVLDRVGHVSSGITLTVMDYGKHVA